MTVKVAVIDNDNIVVDYGFVSEAFAATLIASDPAHYFDVSAYPHLVPGWIYDPVSGTFAPDWPVELANALATLKTAYLAQTGTTTYASTTYDSSDATYLRLVARIRAREERGDLSTDTEMWRVTDLTSAPQSLATDKALLVAMYERKQAVEDVYAQAYADAHDAAANEDVDALYVAIAPTWP